MKLATQSVFTINLAAILTMTAAVLATTSQAAPRSPTDSKREFLADIRELTLKCVIRPYSINARGELVLHPLKSVCPEIHATDSLHAMIQFEGQTYSAELFESGDSDGGDLDDLVIKDSHGQKVAARHNVAAFDEILIALAGGKDSFPFVRE